MRTPLGPDDIAGLNVALNEASLIGVDLDTWARRVVVTLAVLTLPADGGSPPEDPRIAIQLEPVGRIAVSWRDGRWDDASAKVHSLSPSELSSVVAGLGQLPIYGWEFLDAGEQSFATWSARLSLDLHLGPHRRHTLDLFQEAGDESFLELRVWFDELSVARPVDDRLEATTIEEVIAGGTRWWDAMYAGDARLRASGIYPLKS